MMQLNTTYNRDDLLKFLEDNFLTDFKKDIRPANTQGSSSIQKAYSLGRCESLDLQVFEFSFEGSSNKRISLTKDAFQVMKSSAIFRALAIFHSPDSDDWRLSLMTATPERNEKGKVLLSYSNPKRLSFFLGPNAKINTPTKFLINKGKVINFEDLKNRFSIEVVNKEFYKEISQAFTKLVNGLLKLPSTQDKSQTNLEFAVRLIGRVIFCWFLREKKSQAGMALMPKELLSFEAVKTNEDYYHKILEPIFFEILNKTVKSRRDDFAKEPFSSVPYLNGGLFSPQDDDYYKRTNGDLQSQYHNTLVIPDNWLKDFFEILETYNFTIDENTSYDEELSIDPEMLGRIFENLLAEINPETGESARKSTGSYYTPRVIVNYMIDESLLLYLKEQTGIDENKLRAIISYDLDDDLDNPVTVEEKEKIIDALEKVKILDPACGSGAFPIGALQKIVFILQQTDPEGQLWFKKQIQNTSPEIRRVVEREFAYKNFDYIRKLGIIRENIYGVDIQSIATEISRLRCFLTLIVDERIQDEAENRGIEPLPNLDFKFVTANSLIGLPKVDLSQQSMFDDYQKIDDLKNIRDQYFNASGLEREQLKTEFVMAQKRLVDQLIKEHGFMGVAKAELTQKLTDWEPFTHKSTSWFDPEWMFGIKAGFDIVIANPPYVKIQDINKNIPNFTNQLRKIYFSAAGNFDIYFCFVELATKLVSSDGNISYILPNKFFQLDAGKNLRKLIYDNKLLRKVVDFGSNQAFESATTYTCLLFLSRVSSSSVLYKKVSNPKDLSTVNTTSLSINRDTLSSKNWTFSSMEGNQIVNKLSQNSLPLGNIPSRIGRGSSSGADKIFIIKKDENGFQTQSGQYIDIENDILRIPIYATDFGRYTFNPNSEEFIIFPYSINSNSYELKSESEMKTLFPKTYAYLLDHRKELETRKQFKSWYGYSAPRNLDVHENAQMLVPLLANKGSFCQLLKNSDKFCFMASGGFSITIDISSPLTPDYVLGLLNSKLLFWQLSNISNIFRGGWITCTKQYVETLPIHMIDFSNQSESETHSLISNLVKKILDLNGKLGNSTDGEARDIIKKQVYLIEKQIDQLVYKLYGLTPEEINIVEKG